MALTKEQVQTWKGLVESKRYAPITSTYKKKVLVQLLENSCANEVFRNAQGVRTQAKLLTEAPTTNTGPTGIGAGLGTSATSTGNSGDGQSIAGYDPILVSMIRRSAPQLLAYDIVGVQPMTTPTAQIFSLHSRVLNDNGTAGVELFGGFAAPYLNNGVQIASTINGSQDPMLVNGFAKVSTQVGEQASTAAGATYRAKRATITISRVSVTAMTKLLMSEFTDEMAHDLKQLHGMDAKAELANVLSTEIAFEQNREMVETIRYVAKDYNSGSVDLTGGVAADVFTNAAALNGLSLSDRFKTVVLHIEKASNEIARDTRRGKGNFLLVSSDVAAILHLAGVLNINPDFKPVPDLADDCGSLEIGKLIGGQRVVVDPYATQGQTVVGYKGANAMDAGFYWCPYVPLQMVETRDSGSIQPKIGFKTRYGIAANPHSAGFLADGAGIANDQGLAAGTNAYYRKFSLVYG